MTDFIDRIKTSDSKVEDETPAWEKEDLPKPSEVQSERSKKAVTIDLIKQADVIDHTDPEEYKKWVDNPNEYDILNTDTAYDPREDDGMEYSTGDVVDVKVRRDTSIPADEVTVLITRIGEDGVYDGDVYFGQFYDLADEQIEVPGSGGVAFKPSDIMERRRSSVSFDEDSFQRAGGVGTDYLSYYDKDNDSLDADELMKEIVRRVRYGDTLSYSTGVSTRSSKEIQTVTKNKLMSFKQTNIKVVPDSKFQFNDVDSPYLMIEPNRGETNHYTDEDMMDMIEINGQSLKDKDPVNELEKKSMDELEKYKNIEEDLYVAVDDDTRILSPEYSVREESDRIDMKGSILGTDMNENSYRIVEFNNGDLILFYKGNRYEDFEIMVGDGELKDELTNIAVLLESDTKFMKELMEEVDYRESEIHGHIYDDSIRAVISENYEDNMYDCHIYGQYVQDEYGNILFESFDDKDEAKEYIISEVESLKDEVGFDKNSDFVDIDEYIHNNTPYEVTKNDLKKNKDTGQYEGISRYQSEDGMGTTLIGSGDYIKKIPDESPNCYYSSFEAFKKNDPTPVWEVEDKDMRRYVVDMDEDSKELNKMELEMIEDDIYQFATVREHKFKKALADEKAEVTTDNNDAVIVYREDEKPSPLSTGMNVTSVMIQEDGTVIPKQGDWDNGRIYSVIDVLRNDLLELTELEHEKTRKIREGVINMIQSKVPVNDHVKKHGKANQDVVSKEGARYMTDSRYLTREEYKDLEDIPQMLEGAVLQSYSLQMTRDTDGGSYSPLIEPQDYSIKVKKGSYKYDVELMERGSVVYRLDGVEYEQACSRAYESCKVIANTLDARVDFDPIEDTKDLSKMIPVSYSSTRDGSTDELENDFLREMLNMSSDGMSKKEKKREIYYNESYRRELAIVDEIYEDIQLMLQYHAEVGDEISFVQRSRSYEILDMKFYDDGSYEIEIDVTSDRDENGRIKGNGYRDIRYLTPLQVEINKDGTQITGIEINDENTIDMDINNERR